MLVARRDPPFHASVHDAAPDKSAVHPGAHAPKFARFVTVIQLVGSLLAVPVGIGSAYSFYRANFSPEATCQSLRSGIVAMLDKSVDVNTRRILVRRDVEAFKQLCGAVDPDATAAFTALSTTEKTAAPAAEAAPKAQRSETSPKEPVQAEPRPVTPAKQSAANAVRSAAEPVRRDPVVADTQWLDAVRQALVTPPAEQPVSEAAKAQSTPMPVVGPRLNEAVSPAPAIPALGPVVSAPPVPALPPAIAIASPAAQPTARRTDSDHPVPPGLIPDAAPFANADTASPDERGR